MLGETEAPVDLVVTDLSMPDMNGRDLALEVRRRFPGLPVLMLTGDTDADAGDGTVDSVMKKPFKLDALEAEIQRLLTREQLVERRAEDRGQRTEGRGQRAEDRGHGTTDCGPLTTDHGPPTTDH
jgi:DNA-binding response OmpR family regulator